MNRDEVGFRPLDPHEGNLFFPFVSTLPRERLDCSRTRRDQEKYLTLIDAIALLRQYQRPVKLSRGHELRRAGATVR